MSTGVVHMKATVVLSVPAGLLAYSLGAGTGGAAACFAGALTGILLSPDLDVDHRTHSEYVVYHYLGKFLGALWFAFWWPYAKFIPHRHPLSHWPLVGTLGRLLYLSIFGFILWLGVAIIFPGVSPPPTALPAIPYGLRWAIVGLALADILHFLMDYKFMFFRIRRRKRRRKRKR